MIKVIVYKKEGNYANWKPIKRIVCDSIAIHPCVWQHFTKTIQMTLYCFFLDRKDEDYAIDLDQNTGIKIISIDHKD